MSLQKKQKTQKRQTIIEFGSEGIRDIANNKKSWIYDNEKSINTNTCINNDDCWYLNNPDRIEECKGMYNFRDNDGICSVYLCSVCFCNYEIGEFVENYCYDNNIDKLKFIIIIKK